MSEEIFTTYERLETCQRVEVTLENLHILARHLSGADIGRTVRVACEEAGCTQRECIDEGTLYRLEHDGDATVAVLDTNHERTTVILDPSDLVTVTGAAGP